ncbi:MAG: hypothetical protein JXB36_06360 [Gammaproteobacteria bacterium]|nr:hypothetical protein [Gammaproteobacteria bacterium]
MVAIKSRKSLPVASDRLFDRLLRAVPGLLRQLPAARRRPRWYLAAALGAALIPPLAAAAPKAPGTLCLNGSCATTKSQTGDRAVKWNPGHYMQIRLGDSTDDMQAKRFGWYDEIASNTAIEGVALRLTWGQLEKSKGNYTFGMVRAELDKLKSLAVPKRLFIRLHDRAYGSSGQCGSGNMFPQDLRNGKGCADTGHGNTARLWDPDVTSRLIELYRAIAQEFDDEPYFEGLMLIRETATNGEVRDPSFSFDRYVAQLKRLATAASEAFEQSNVVMSVNFLGSQERVDSVIAHSAKVGVGQGGPDVLPRDLARSHPLAYNTLDGSSTGVEYRKRMPVLYSIEASQLGGSLCRTCTPRDLHEFAVGTLHASHLLWTRNTDTGSSSQQWEHGILPWIQEHPIDSTGCPDSYAACKSSP